MQVRFETIDTYTQTKVWEVEAESVSILEADMSWEFPEDLRGVVLVEEGEFESTSGMDFGSFYERSE